MEISSTRLENALDIFLQKFKTVKKIFLLSLAMEYVGKISPDVKRVATTAYSTLID